MTLQATATAPLFEPLQIKPRHPKNRLVRSATHEGLADDKGFPSDKRFRFYGRLANGGVGLIITGFAYVVWRASAACRG